MPMPCACDTPITSYAESDPSPNCCPTAFCHDLLLSLPESSRMNVVGVRSGSKCLNVFPRKRTGFLVNDGKGGAIVTSQPQVPIPYLRTLLYDGSGQPIIAETGNPEEDSPPGVDSLVVSGGCGLQWRYRGRAGYRQRLVWDGCKWITENDNPSELDDFPSVDDGNDDCEYLPMVLVRQSDGSYRIGYRATHYRFPGEIITYGGPLSTMPDDCLACDGFSYDPLEYPELFANIGYRWGNDSGNFRVPDLRGHFLRGVDHGEAVDPDANTRTAKYTGGNTGDQVGSYQEDAFQCHDHDLPIEQDASVGSDDGLEMVANVDLMNEDTLHAQLAAESTCGEVRTADETRPKNAYVEFIIYAGCKEALL